MAAAPSGFRAHAAGSSVSSRDAARTLAGPSDAELMFGASVNGVVLGTVRDTAAFLDVITGFEQAVRSWRSHRSGRTATRSAETRAGWASASRPTRHSARRSTGRRCRPAQCGGLLEELGHDVVDAEPALNGDRFLRGFLAMVLHLRLMVDEAKARSGCGDDAFAGETVLLAAVGRTPSANPTWAATTPARWSPRRTAPWRRPTGQPPPGSREP
jgi:amidase